MMKTMRLILALLGVAAGGVPAAAATQSYLIGPSISTTTGRLTENFAGVFSLAASSQSILTPTITLDGTAGSIRGSSATWLFGVSAATGVFTGTGNAIYDLTLSSGILVNAGGVTAPWFSGNLVGNVTGNITGNITGNVTGSASLNVLKAGDTMTGSLLMSAAVVMAPGQVYTSTWSAQGLNEFYGISAATGTFGSSSTTGNETTITLLSGSGRSAYIPFGANGVAANAFVGMSGANSALITGDIPGDLSYRVHSGSRMHWSANDGTTIHLALDSSGFYSWLPFTVGGTSATFRDISATGIDGASIKIGLNPTVNGSATLTMGNSSTKIGWQWFTNNITGGDYTLTPEDSPGAGTFTTPTLRFSAGNMAVGNILPGQTKLDVDGSVQAGSGITKSTIDVSGNVKLDFNAKIYGAFGQGVAAPILWGNGSGTAIQDSNNGSVGIRFLNFAGGQLGEAYEGGYWDLGGSSPDTSAALTIQGGTSGRKIRSQDETTGRVFGYFTNSGGQLVWGVDSSAGGNLLTGALAYASEFYTNNGTALQFGTNDTLALTIDTAQHAGFGGIATIPSTSSVITPSLSVTGTAQIGTVKFNDGTTQTSAAATLGNTALLASTQTFSGANTFTSTVTVGVASGGVYVTTANYASVANGMCASVVESSFTAASTIFITGFSSAAYKYDVTFNVVKNTAGVLKMTMNGDNTAANYGFANRGLNASATSLSYASAASLAYIDPANCDSTGTTADGSEIFSQGWFLIAPKLHNKVGYYSETAYREVIDFAHLNHCYNFGEYAGSAPLSNIQITNTAGTITGWLTIKACPSGLTP